MDSFHTDGNSQVVSELRGIAIEVSAIFRVEIEMVRDAVRRVMRQRLDIHKSLKRRDQERLDEFKKSSVFRREGGKPQRPGNGYFLHEDTLRVSIDLPKNSKGWSDTDKFEYVKQRGFPDNGGSVLYRFPFWCWLPNALNPKNDPQLKNLLPIPAKKNLELDEKVTILAAIYDAYIRGEEEIAPWKAVEWSEPEIDDSCQDRSSLDAPVPQLTDAEWDDWMMYNFYSVLVHKAVEATTYDVKTDDVEFMRSWLPEVREALRARAEIT